MHDLCTCSARHLLRGIASTLAILAARVVRRVGGRRTLDLGRFELFRMQFNEPPFSLLLDHRDSLPTSALQVWPMTWLAFKALKMCALPPLS